MIFDKIRSHAKINLALNVTGKDLYLHKIESIIMFSSLHDIIFLKKTKSIKHKIQFFGKFSKGISTNNTVSRLLKLLDNRNLLKDKKFFIKINKKIPIKSGLGGGSMNAASILNYFIKKKIIKISNREVFEICNLIGSDVVIGLKPTNTILTSENKIKHFHNKKRLYLLIIKPNFGCKTKMIYSGVKKFKKPKFSNPNKKMFRIEFLKNSINQLEQIAFFKYPELKSIKSYLLTVLNPIFVRMTGSGSALVAYYESKENCENAKKKIKKKYKNYWCIASKTI